MGVTQGNVVVGILEDGILKIGAYGAAEGACTDVGGTEGGVEISVPQEFYEVTCDQAIGVIDIRKISEKCNLKITLAEATFDLLSKATNYDPASSISGSVMSFGGKADVEYLTLFLDVRGVNGGTRQYHFWKAVCIGSATHKYVKNDKTMIECEFQVIQDLTKTDEEQLGTITDTGADTTAPTIAMTTPADGGTVTKDAAGTVTLTITETNLMNENTIVYGNEDGATIQIVNITTPATPVLVAGTIVYNAAAKTVVFTPTANWTASDDLIVVVTTGLADAAGNHLASTFYGGFTVT